MRKPKTTKKWSDIRSELVRRLTSEVSKDTSVTADRNVSQTESNNQMPVPKNMAMVRDQQRMRAKGLVPPKPLTNIERLQLPDVEAKRKAGFDAYWAKRRKRKEQMDKWRDKHGLTSVNFIIPDDLLQAFKAKAESESKTRTEVLRELMLDYITRPDKS
jgi:hypothetical protein